jgi:hypothetical protein
MLVLLRFFFGFALGWAAVVILMIATLVCIKLIGISLRLFAQRCSQDLASGICICAVVATAIGALYFCGYRLYDFLASLPWVDEPQAWLAGNGHVSLVALLGTTCAIALPAYLRVYVSRRWQRTPPQKAFRPEVSTPTRPTRVGWLPLLLLGLGATLLALAYAVAPQAPVSAPAMRQYQEYGERIWPVYVVAGILLGAGVLTMLVNVFWRRRH